jgi:hypothetical protein
MSILVLKLGTTCVLCVSEVLVDVSEIRFRLEQRFPTCGTRTTKGQTGSGGGARENNIGDGGKTAKEKIS